jgi:2-dehydropantoate 2-reductase
MNQRAGKGNTPNLFFFPLQAIQALSGLPIRAELYDHSFRTVLSYCISEALAVYAKAGIQTRSFNIIPVPWIPFSLVLPNWIFTRVASSILG